MEGHVPMILLGEYWVEGYVPIRVLGGRICTYEGISMKDMYNESIGWKGINP